MWNVILFPKSQIILHDGTNDTEICTSREILDNLLKLKPIITEKLPGCRVIISTPTYRSDNGKAALTVSHLRQKLISLTVKTSTINI